MNKRERERFINGLIENVRKDLVEENAKYPLEWDGIELRERIKDVFSQVVIKESISPKRKRDYNNFVLVNGLI
jgi:hypothetical protein